MNALNFLDANVWLALLWGRHIHSAKAREWFERSSDERFLFCRITQITVLRLLTTQAVMGSDVKTTPEAWNLWDQVCADDRVEFLSEPEALDKEFRSFSSLHSASPKVWVDAYLLAFVSLAGVKLITFDRGLRSRRVDVQVLWPSFAAASISWVAAPNEKRRHSLDFDLDLSRFHGRAPFRP